jgi:hypothetical protein
VAASLDEGRELMQWLAFVGCMFTHVFVTTTVKVSVCYVELMM